MEEIKVDVDMAAREEPKGTPGSSQTASANIEDFKGLPRTLKRISNGGGGDRLFNAALAAQMPPGPNGEKQTMMGAREDITRYEENGVTNSRYGTMG